METNQENQVNAQQAAADARLRTGIDRSVRHPVMFFFTRFISPGVWDNCSWMATGKVDIAHINILIYGWGVQAALGAIVWLMARLTRRECTQPGIILAAGHVWNLGVALGVLGIFMGYGTGVAWLEFPTFAWPVLVLAFGLSTVWSVIQFRVREKGHVYISQWYLLGAVFWFPWVYVIANVFIFCFDGHPLMAAAVASWFKGTLLLLFFAPVAMGSAYYFIPKVTGKPVFSYNLATLAFWILAIVGPWAGMQKLAGAPLFNGLPYLSATATALFAIPALMVGVNLLLSMGGDNGRVGASPALRFTAAGVVGLIFFGLSGLFLNLPGVLEAVQFSMSGYGYEILGLYGMFSLCMFGAIYFIVPRITGREWLSKRFIEWHFWLSVYGVISVVLFGVTGGFFEGAAQNEGYKFASWENQATRGIFYNTGIAIAWFCILISNIFFFLHLLLMWMRLGRRSSHPTLLGHESHGTINYETDGVHGPEGDIDELNATSSKQTA